MQEIYYTDSSIQDFKTAVDAVSMIIGGALLIGAGIVAIENLANKRNNYYY